MELSFREYWVREHAAAPWDGFSASSVDMGINPALEKGGRGRQRGLDAVVRHLRAQDITGGLGRRPRSASIDLGGVLHPDVRWWEAIEVPRQAVQFVEVAELDVRLAWSARTWPRTTRWAELIRSVGPTIVFPVLRHAPQLILALGIMKC